MLGSLSRPSRPTSCRVKPSKATRASLPSCTSQMPPTTTSQSPKGPSPNPAVLLVRSCPPPVALLLSVLLPLLLLAPLLLLPPPPPPLPRCRDCRMSPTPTPGSRLAASRAWAGALRVTYVPLLAYTSCQSPRSLLAGAPPRSGWRSGAGVGLAASSASMLLSMPARAFSPPGKMAAG